MEASLIYIGTTRAHKANKSIQEKGFRTLTVEAGVRAGLAAGDVEGSEDRLQPHTLCLLRRHQSLRLALPTHPLSLKIARTTSGNLRPSDSAPLGGPWSAAGGDPARGHPHAQAGPALLLRPLAALQWQVRMSGAPGRVASSVLRILLLFLIMCRCVSPRVGLCTRVGLCSRVQVPREARGRGLALQAAVNCLTWGTRTQPGHL